jgi:LPXTG-motif cell wall-anchored protein
MISIEIWKICIILCDNLVEGSMSMFYTIIGILDLLLGFGGLLLTYKNRYKINMAAIFSKKDMARYEIDNEKKFLRLQNIKSLFLDVSFISIGVVGLWGSSKIYILMAIIPAASSIIFSNIGIDYVKLKAKVYL